MIEENNKLIAEFMGVHVAPLGLRRNVMVKSYLLQELQYHTSWSWLMPVVEKIERLGHCVDIYNNVCIIPHLKKQIGKTVEFWDLDYNHPVTFKNYQKGDCYEIAFRH